MDVLPKAVCTDICLSSLIFSAMSEIKESGSDGLLLFLRNFLLLVNGTVEDGLSVSFGLLVLLLVVEFLDLAVPLESEEGQSIPFM